MRPWWRRTEILLLLAALASLGFSVVLLTRLGHDADAHGRHAFQPPWRRRAADESATGVSGVSCDDEEPARCLYFAGGASPLAASYDGVAVRVCQRRELGDDGCCEVPSRLEIDDKSDPTAAVVEPCAACDSDRGCCGSLVTCIVCCLSPGNAADRAALQRLLVRLDAANPAYAVLAEAEAEAEDEHDRRRLHTGGARCRDSTEAAVPQSAAAAFRFCTLRCRTSAGATWHENRYRSAQANHCYGAYRPSLAAAEVAPAV
jgi:hypothetical protein